MPDRPRVAFLVHDGTGLGHLVRALRIGMACAKRLSCAVFTGSVEACDLAPPGVDVRLLPTVHQLFERGAAGSSDGGVATGHLQAAVAERRRMLESAVGDYGPDAIVADYRPYGKWDEWRDLLARSPARKYLVLRGVLDTPSRTRAEILGPEDSHLYRYDRIFIACDRRVLDPAAHYGFLPETRSRTLHVGYVSPAIPTAAARDLVRADRGVGQGQRWVVVSAGGGRLAGDLVAAAEQVARRRDDIFWDIVCGPRSDRSHQAGSSSTRVRIRSADWTLPTLHQSADVVICPGGYNSLAECLSGGTPVIVCPAQAPGDAEQLTHGLALAPWHDVEIVSEPGAIEGALRRVLARQSVGRSPLELDLRGADTIARVMLRDLSGAVERTPDGPAAR